MPSTPGSTCSPVRQWSPHRSERCRETLHVGRTFHLFHGLRPAWKAACTQAPGRPSIYRQFERVIRRGPEITERNRDLDHLAVSWKRLAGSFLVPLHRVHEFKFIACILLLEGGGVDSLSSLLADPGFRVRTRGSRTVLVCRFGAIDLIAPVPTRTSIDEQSVFGKARKIEFVGRRFRLIIVMRHGGQTR
jgi:hypothetical protein